MPMEAVPASGSVTIALKSAVPGTDCAVRQVARMRGATVLLLVLDARIAPKALKMVTEFLRYRRATYPVKASIWPPPSRSCRVRLPKSVRFPTSCMTDHVIIYSMI
jgi:hypothetical protein